MKPKSRDEYRFTMLCPICQYTKDLHIERDSQVVKESGCDAMYYDISANNILKICMSDQHNHQIGAGKMMTEAYRMIYVDTKEKLTEIKGQYVPLGTEMIFLANTTDFTQDVLMKDDMLQADGEYDVCFDYVTNVSDTKKMAGKEL